jgi:rhomboid protease GluP
MEPATARIPTGSRRQAMDWSLVLASQGIEPTIDYAEDEGGGWGLLVGQTEVDRALQIIQQYQFENRRWPWRREVFQPGFLFDWASVAWVLLLVVFYWLNKAPFDLRAGGLMDSTAVAHGQWWRLFTAIWLHADLAHLASNATFGFVLIGLAMARYGTGAGLLAAYLAGAGGNVASWLLWPAPHYGLGASGMVMGGLGLLAVQSFSLWRQTPHATKHIIAGLCGGVMLFVLFGLTPGTDVVAHFGGFLTGVVLGSLLTLWPNLAQRVTLNFFAGLLFAAFVIWPWWLALTRAG